jgi:ketol-acid reductoisomerase
MIKDTKINKYLTCDINILSSLDFKRFLNGNYCHTRSFDLFKEYGVENCKIELIEYYKCDTLQELRKREGEHIKNTECVNKVVPGRTCKEYYDDNKNKLNEMSREWKKQNKDKIKEYEKEYREQNKERIKEKHT